MSSTGGALRTVRPGDKEPFLLGQHLMPDHVLHFSMSQDMALMFIIPDSGS